jgi:hypothetical protein
MVVALFHADRHMDGQRGRHEGADSCFFLNTLQAYLNYTIFKRSEYITHPLIQSK